MVACVLACVGCAWFLPPPFVISGASDSLFEVRSTTTTQPLTIELVGPLAQPRAELSGLAWYGDTLILLPQFPARFDNQLFGLPKADIIAYVTGQASAPLQPQPIALDDGAVQALLVGSEGYESITFDGDGVFMTIETQQLTGMLGYVVAGTMAPDANLLQLDPSRLTPIEPQSDLRNLTDEAIFLIDSQVATIYEANGLAVNPDPVVHLFDRVTLAPVGVTPFPQIEYRVTDATALDAENRFWVMNYFYPGDYALRAFLRRRGALGAINEQAQPVERLLEFQVTNAGIVRTATPPLALSLLYDETAGAWVARNWEGIVRLESTDANGFLLVTDSFPATILAYVPTP
jgi:hypothetical protein